MISIGSALDAVGTNDNPLLRRITCALDNWVSVRLTMLHLAHWKQSGLGHSSGVCGEFCFLFLSLRHFLLCFVIVLYCVLLVVVFVCALL